MSLATAWRITRAAHADLSGEGARRYGGRWNSPGRAVVYLSENAALPALEAVVHLDIDRDLLPDDYVLMRVDLTPLAADGEGWVEAGPDSLPPDPDCRRIGDDWLIGGRKPVLSVPSVIVPECRNLLLNPTHPLAARIAEPATRRFAFDARLLDRPAGATPPRP